MKSFRQLNWSTLSAAITATTAGMVLIAGTAHAQSSVQLYGQIDEWVGSQKPPGGQRTWELGGGGMSTSYWGFKGSEDLGSDFKTIFALEAFFRPQNGQYGRFAGDTFFGRNAYVGVESRYGTFAAGRLTTQLFISTILFNPFADSFQFSPMIYHTYLGMGTFPAYPTDQGSLGDSSWNNAVSYSSPNFGGLTGGVMYALGNQAGLASQHKDSAQVLYFNGPLAATAAYQYMNFNTVAGDFANPAGADVVAALRSQSIAQLGVTYDLKFVKLYSQYMLTRNSVATGDYHVNTGQGGFTVPVAGGTVMASYAYSKDAGGLNQKRSTYALGYDYPLSRRTDLYAAYMSDKFSAQPAGDTFGVGIRVKF